jgi:hypothetical protein
MSRASKRGWLSTIRVLIAEKALLQNRKQMENHPREEAVGCQAHHHKPGHLVACQDAGRETRVQHGMRRCVTRPPLNHKVFAPRGNDTTVIRAQKIWRGAKPRAGGLRGQIRLHQMIEDGGAILIALARMAATITTTVVVGLVAGYDRWAAVAVSDEKALSRIKDRPQRIWKGEKRIAVDEAAKETSAWHRGHLALDA